MEDPNSTISYWHLTAQGKEYPKLNKDIETDTLIIGGGITGVSAAYCLAKVGVSTTLIEADKLCAGTTGGTTGKCTIQHGIIYSRLIDTMGLEKAFLYAKAQKEALAFISTFVRANKIECNYEETEAYIYASSKDQIDLVKKEYEAAKQLNIAAEYVNAPSFPNDNYCMTGFKGQAAFHPVRYISSLAEHAQKAGAAIYEHSKAIKVEEDKTVTVKCENGVIIKAKHLILATQYPIYEGMGAFFSRLYPRRTYGMAVETPNDWPNGCYINAGTPTRSLRTHVENGKRILIVVGESHPTARGGDMETHYNELMHFAGITTGLNNVVTRWSAQDYKTPDDLPFIGRLSSRSNIFVGTGFGKWGLTNGTLAGMMIHDIITSGHSEYEDLLNPHRLNLKASAPTLLGEISGQVRELVHSKLKVGDNFLTLKPGEGKVVEFKGKKAGAYLSDDDVLTIVDTTCTHLGCEVQWNSAEKTWDCPCHGGRYAYDGKLLEGPPKNSLKVIYKEDKKVRK